MTDPVRLIELVTEVVGDRVDVTVFVAYNVASVGLVVAEMVGLCVLDPDWVSVLETVGVVVEDP